MKKFLALILAVMTVFAFTGCGKTAKQIDINAVGKILDEGCSFEETPAYIDDTAFALNSMAADTALVKKTDNGYACYKAVSASTPEIVLIIEAVDAKAADELNNGPVKNLITKNIEGYSDYGPEYVPMLESCVNTVAGNYVFLIVCKDNTAAEKLLNEQIY